MQSKKLLILNGPGLADLGEPDLSLAVIERECQKLCEQLGLQMEFRQTDGTDQLHDWVASDGSDFDAFIINPVCSPDASTFEACRASIQQMAELNKPVVEVHLTNILSGDASLSEPLQTPAGEVGFIAGLGLNGYLLAIKSIAVKIGAEA